MPDVVVHFARMVHTPVGAAPAGLLVIPGEGNPARPRIIGFVSPDPKVAAYFGPNIFAGTPFEHAPVLVGQIEVALALAQQCAYVRIQVAGIVVESTLSGLAALTLVERAAGVLPFYERALEGAARATLLLVNGRTCPVLLPPTGMSGGPPAVYSAAGFYAR